jgi:murein DD-endopeptidase MepM/ murein hydrolase activator NlpD
MSVDTTWYGQAGYAYEDYGPPYHFPQQPPLHEDQTYPYYQFADDTHPPLEAGPMLLHRRGRSGTRMAVRRAARRRRSAILAVTIPTAAVLGIAGATAATLAYSGPAPTHQRVRDHSQDLARPDSRPDARPGGLPGARARQPAAARAGEAAAALAAAKDRARLAQELRAAAARQAAAEAAPRYVLPISVHTGLSALFGQAGSRWMQLHTGIDFPVDEGTAVHAVTDGTVSTRWNIYYGYMLMVTAPDRTQTWYCHLSAYRLRSGRVRAGDTVAYSGDTGNSTGPHLHFEVHPYGGEAVDPLPWLLDRGLDPR